MGGINFKKHIHLVLLTVLVLFAIINYFQIYSNTKALELGTECLIKIETIGSGMQRISKLELEKSYDNELIAELEHIVNYELFSNGDINSPNYFIGADDMLVIIENCFEDWFVFYDAVLTFREDNQRDVLFSISELKYENFNNQSTLLKEYNASIGSDKNKFEQALIVNIVLIALILAKTLSNLASELKQNKELSKDMYLDTSTGLYNGSKCQEVLKQEYKNNKNNKQRAVIVCDLNGLKKTNDEHGHRAGDQLIYCFATELKNATDIFDYEVFVGRYGGDEFIVVFEHIEETEIKDYIKQVNFLMDDFNQKQNKPFKLACAIGYSITTKETQNLTMKELFDFADEDMYKNKIAMKERQKKLLEEQGIKVENEVDDRL